MNRGNAIHALDLLFHSEVRHFLSGVSATTVATFSSNDKIQTTACNEWIRKHTSGVVGAARMFRPPRERARARSGRKRMTDIRSSTINGPTPDPAWQAPDLPLDDGRILVLDGDPHPDDWD